MSKTEELLKDLFTGCCSGWGQVITMMPFENIKVSRCLFRLKSFPNLNNTLAILMLSRKPFLRKDILDFIREC